MLKALNLEKTYYTKAGASQKALDKVSVELNSKGLVFILGKSGSGKSTLLNILGGLDTADAGEIEIKGKSSKDFNQNDFDSYRNTYLGFIFQDFNILPDFTVKENINLAYELQHKKASEEKLNEILKQVDMLEYKDRKPNELSGGQIQRVAIARALIKNPQIIMADEPTGNLDSETSEQVFNTLKNLSKEKLVLVVSHDKDAAEEYADRIIELKDGKIIKDVTKEVIVQKSKVKNNVKMLSNKLVIKNGAKLTNDDLSVLNQAISKNMQIEISTKKEAKNFDKLESFNFIETSKTKSKKAKSFEPFKLIKSKLPTRKAFKMGASGLKYKKVKLAITLLLTIVAVTLFGFMNVMGNFSVAKVSANTFKDSHYTILPFIKYNYIEKYDYYEQLQPTKEQIELFEAKTGKEAFSGYNYYTSIDELVKNEIPSYNDYYLRGLEGVIEFPNEEALQNDYVGRFPENYKEIMINNYIFEHFVDFGLRYYDEESNGFETLENITSFSQIENKLINLSIDRYDDNFKIVGMVNYNLTDYNASKEGWSKITQESSWEERRDLFDFYNDKEQLLGRIIVKEGFHQENYVNKFKEGSFRLTSFYTGEKDFSLYAYLNENLAPEGLTEEEKAEFLIKDNLNVNDISNIQVVLNNPSMQDYYYFGGDVDSLSSLNDNQIIVSASWFLEKEHYDNIIDGNNSQQYGYNPEKLDELLNTTITIKIMSRSFYEGEYSEESEKTFTIAGFYVGDYYSGENTIVVNENYIDNILSYENSIASMYTNLTANSSNIELFETMENNNFRHQTTISEEIYGISQMFEIMKEVFMYFSIILGVFATFLIMNFISNSIGYKKKEIGILRALGARKTDVFKVFYAEGVIMGIIDYIASMILIVIGANLFNNYIKDQMSTSVTVLNVGVMPFIAVGLICFGVIFIASYLPVRKTASKKPIDAIRGK